MFLVIENAGIAPVESFTMLGLSTARGNAAKIGQFGSGAKHGILTAIRHKLNPRIYLGKDELAFYTEPGKMGDKAYDKLCYLWQDKAESTSMVLEFGSLDWAGLDMALREFVSNAIDAGDGETLVKVGLREKIEPQPNTTLVAFELTPEVQKFYTELPMRFLQFNQAFQDNIPNGPMPKLVDDSKPRIYRKGVFVREGSKVWNSLFDYNFGDEMKIDESRNAEDYYVMTNAALSWRKADLKQIMPYLSKMTEKTYEYNFASYTLCDSYSGADIKTLYKNAFDAVHGSDTLIVNEPSKLAVEALKKGYKVLHVTSNGWYTALANAGVETVNHRMEKSHDITKDGEKTIPTSSKLLARVLKIWTKLDNAGLTNGKGMPQVKQFVSLMEGEAKKLGFYKNNTIFISDDATSNNAVILEELAHHITGSTDNSRDFQDYAFKVAATFMARKRK